MIADLLSWRYMSQILYVVENSYIGRVLESTFEGWDNVDVAWPHAPLCGARYDEIYVCLDRPYPEGMEAWIEESVKTRIKPEGKYVG